MLEHSGFETNTNVSLAMIHPVEPVLYCHPSLQGGWAYWIGLLQVTNGPNWFLEGA